MLSDCMVAVSIWFVVFSNDMRRFDNTAAVLLKLSSPNNFQCSALGNKGIGVIFTSDNITNKEVKEQVTKANRIAGFLKHFIWHIKHLSHDTKVRIYIGNKTNKIAHCGDKR